MTITDLNFGCIRNKWIFSLLTVLGTMNGQDLFILSNGTFHIFPLAQSCWKDQAFIEELLK